MDRSDQLGGRTEANNLRVPFRSTSA